MKAIKHKKNDLFCVICKNIKGSLEIYFEIEYPTKIDREIMICCKRCKDKLIAKMNKCRDVALKLQSNHQTEMINITPLKIRPLTVIQSNSKFY